MIDELANLLTRGPASIIDVQADHLEPPLSVLLCEPCKLRRLLSARGTPGGPEIQHQHLAAIIGELNRAAIDRGNVEVSRHACGRSIRNRRPRQGYTGLGSCIGMSRKQRVTNRCYQSADHG